MIPLAGLCLTQMRLCRKPFAWSFRSLSSVTRHLPWSAPLPSSTCASRRGFRGGKRADELIWSRLTHERVLNILHSPLYAGAYVYGRTKFRRHTLPGEEPRIKGRTRRVKQEDWPIVLLDAHPGYITWQHFLHNQRQLDDNRTQARLRSIEARFERGHRSCKASSCVARAADA